MSERKVASLEARAKAVADALVDGGHLPEGALEAVEQIEEGLDWGNGARVGAKAWTDPAWHRL